MIDLENMSILVVDDMKSMRLTIRKMLRTLNIGKMLRFADNGRAGLEVLKETPCDMAIIDWNMPVMNGTQMLTHLRKDKVLRDMPVIMVTAENERDIVSEVAEGEIDAYLLKPLTLAALDKKIRAVVNSANNPDPATLCMLEARTLEEEEKYEQAVDKVRMALTHKPSASRIIRKLGLLHFKINKPGIGEKCLQKAVSVNRQDTISLDHLGNLYLERGEYQKAARIYMQILKLSTRYFDQALSLGQTLMENGFTSEGLGLFSRIVAKCRRSNRLKEQIIDTCMQHKEYGFVINILEQALKENPSNVDLMFKAGLVHQETGNYERALEYFRSVDTGKKGDVDAKLQIARIYYVDRKVLKADEYLNQVLRIDPGNADALSLRQKL